MKKSDFYYDLPQRLIAQAPLPERSSSRLLKLEGDTGALQDMMFADLPSLLRPGDLLVFNDTRVIPARLYGHKSSGGKIEILIERIVGNRHALAQLRARVRTSLTARALAAPPRGRPSRRERQRRTRWLPRPFQGT